MSDARFGPRGSIRREIVLFGVVYAALGLSCIGLAFARPATPFAAHVPTLLLLGSVPLLVAAIGTFLGRSWTRPIALLIHLLMLLGGVVLSTDQVAKRTESDNLLLMVVTRGAAIALYSAFALFWMRPAVRESLARRSSSDERVL